MQPDNNPLMTQRKSFFSNNTVEKKVLTNRVLDQRNGRAFIITSTFNFKDIDTPFGDNDLTLQNLKLKKQMIREQQRILRHNL